MINTILLFSYLKSLEPSMNFNISKIVYYICIIFCSLVRVARGELWKLSELL